MHTIRTTVVAVALGAAALAAQAQESPAPGIDVELQAAIDVRNAAQARVDSLQAAALFAATQAHVDAAYAPVLAAGVTLAPYPNDYLYVTVVLPMAIATPDERLRWATAKVTATESGVRIIQTVPGRWTIHRQEIDTLFGALSGALAATTNEGVN